MFRTDSRIKLVIDAPNGFGSGQSFTFPFAGWSWDALPGPTDVTISHAESKLVLPTRTAVRTLAPVLPSSHSSCAGYEGPDVAFNQFCRDVPTIDQFTWSVTPEGLVTLTAASTGAGWLAVNSGIRWTPVTERGVAGAGFMSANGNISFHAPPGRHNYTLWVFNGLNVGAHKTIVVDVPGIDGPDAISLPAPQTHRVTWSSPGTKWWVHVNGVPVPGASPTQNRWADIPASMLPTRVDPHIVTLSTCRTPPPPNDVESCSTEMGVTTPVSGTVTSITGAFTPVEGTEDSKGLIATVTPPTGPPVNIYTSWAGVAFPQVPVGATVTAGQRIAGVALTSSSQEQLSISVG